MNEKRFESAARKISDLIGLVNQPVTLFGIRLGKTGTHQVRRK